MQAGEPAEAPAGGAAAQAQCPLEAAPSGLGEALLLVGDRWSPAIVAALLDGPLRFGSLQERLAAISPNVLSQRLRALQASGLLLATPYSRRPTRYLYELTSTGTELAMPLRLLGDWGARHAGLASQTPRHGACERPLELRWYCPTCEEPVGDPSAQEAEQLYYA